MKGIEAWEGVRNGCKSERGRNEGKMRLREGERKREEDVNNLHPNNAKLLSVGVGPVLQFFFY